MNTKILLMVLALLLGYPILKQATEPLNTQYFWFSYTQSVDHRRLESPISFCVVDSVVYAYTHRSYNRIPSYAPVDTLFVGEGYPINSDDIPRYYTRKILRMQTAQGIRDSIILINPRIKDL